MANRIPLIVDTTDGNKIKELPVSDNLDLTGSSIVNVVSVQTQTLSIGGTAFSGSYAELSNKPIIPTDIGDLTDTQGLLGQGSQQVIISGSGVGSGLILAADDSVQRIIVPGNTLKIQGSGGVTTTLTTESGTDVLTISHPVSDLNTTYSLTALTAGADKIIRLTDDVTFATQDIRLIAGTNVSIQQDGTALTFNASDTNTTYSISSVTDDEDDIALRLLGSSGASADVKFIGGSNISVTRTDSNLITIANTQTLPNTFGQIVIGSTTLTADGVADNFNLIASTGIELSGNSETNAITISSPNQNIFQTIAADTGSRLAQTATDQLNIVGGSDISTSISNNVLTINYTGAGAGDAPNMFQYVAVGTPDSNVQLIADSPTDILYVGAGTGISITATGTGGGITVDQLIITNTQPNVDQNLWATVAGDTGSTTANTTTDTLTIQGGDGISTSVSGDTVTITNSLTIQGGDGITTSVSGDTVTITATSSGGINNTRTTANVTTSSILNNASADATITGFKGYVLYKIQTTAASWVRLYTDTASRTADASRLQGVDPAPDAGVVAEIITTGADTVLMSPGVYGFNNEGTPTSAIPIRVTNLSGETTTFTITLTLLQVEA